MGRLSAEVGRAGLVFRPPTRQLTPRILKLDCPVQYIITAAALRDKILLCLMTSASASAGSM
jgi:hypothetical protein